MVGLDEERRRQKIAETFQAMSNLTTDQRAGAIMAGCLMLIEELPKELLGVMGRAGHIALFGDQPGDRGLTIQDMVERILNGLNQIIPE